MNYKISLGIALLHLFIFFAKGSALDSIPQQEIVYPVFESEKPLKFTLIFDRKTIKHDDSDDPQYSPGKLIFHNDSLSDIDFNIKVKARGYSRRIFDFCSFPPRK